MLLERAIRLSKLAFNLAVLLVVGGIIVFIYAVYLGVIGSYSEGLTASGLAVILLLGSGALTFVSMRLARRIQNDSKKS